MIKLPDTYRKNSYDFSLVERDGDVAIYEQLDDLKRVVAYEVFEVMKFAERKMGGNNIPAREGTPSNEQWGNYGYTVWTLDAAKDEMKRLQARIVDRAAKINSKLLR